MTFCKYSFPSQSIWNAHKAQITDSENNPINCAVVEIGQICIETDSEGNCVTLDDSFAVDIMWFADIPETFNEFEVFPNPVGVHIFAGCEAIYLERFCQFNPDSPFCNPEP